MFEGDFLSQRSTPQLKARHQIHEAALIFADGHELLARWQFYFHGREFLQTMVIDETAQDRRTIRLTETINDFDICFGHLSVVNLQTSLRLLVAAKLVNRVDVRAIGGAMMMQNRAESTSAQR